MADNFSRLLRNSNTVDMASLLWVMLIRETAA